ncbi:MAG TPA: hypothetical protein VF041_21895 [Gemmatimonadaceae bacterium]
MSLATTAVAEPTLVLGGDSGALHWQTGAVRGETYAERTVLTHVDTPAVLHVEHGRLRRGPGYAAAPALVRRELARTGAILRLRERGAYVVHASGVVDHGGRAWLFIGNSGSGKSTLAFALARRGWRVLGDDGVVLRPAVDGTLVAHGWRDPLRVSAALCGIFPELAPLAPLIDEQDERRRVPADVPFAARAPVAACICLEPGGCDGLARQSETAAMAALIVQSPWVLLGDAHAPAHFDALRRVASTVPCWRLVNTDRQLHDIGRTIDSLRS